MHPQLRLFTLQLFLDSRAIFFPEWPLIFLIITIHQVIWPSPGTLLPSSLPLEVSLFLTQRAPFSSLFFSPSELRAGLALSRCCGMLPLCCSLSESCHSVAVYRNVVILLQSVGIATSMLQLRIHGKQFTKHFIEFISVHTNITIQARAATTRGFGGMSPFCCSRSESCHSVAVYRNVVILLQSVGMSPFCCSRSELQHSATTRGAFSVVCEMVPLHTSLLHLKRNVTSQTVLLRRGAWRFGGLGRTKQFYKVSS